jgi:hypothetical protein
MNRILTFREIGVGYAIAGITLCLGLYFGIKIGNGDPSGLILKSSYLLAVLIVLKFTFAWGRLRGFSPRNEDGSISVSHMLRNLVMAVLVWVMLSALFAPFLLLAVKLAR